MEYFIVENGQQAGPYTIDELIRRGLNSDTLVWTEGMADWTPAWQVAELKQYLYGQQQPTPTPPPTPVAPTPQPTTEQEQEYEPVRKPKKKGKSHIMLWIGVAIILFAVVLLATTCPDRKQHQEVIRDNLSSALTSTISDAMPLPKQLKQIGGMMGESVITNIINPLLDDVLVYHNYIFFSTTSVEFGGKSHTASIGLLGKVFTMDESDMASTIKDSFGKSSDGKSANEWLSTSPDSDNEQAGNDDTNSDDAEENATTEDEDIVNDVKDVVKKHVKKKVDPNGDKGLGDVVDKLIDMI